jgi:hypothetical protein
MNYQLLRVTGSKVLHTTNHHTPHVINLAHAQLSV